MGEWVERVWRWRFEWRRKLFLWENQLLERMKQALLSTQPRPGTRDRWIWEADMEGVFSVKSAYEAQGSYGPLENMEVFKRIWSIAAPSNVISFTWRVLLGRIQTKDNLLKMNIIAEGFGCICVLCEEHLESIGHLFFSCKFTWGIWMNCYRWLGVCSVFQEESHAHFLQHGQMLTKSFNEGWWSVWDATVWSIWLHRNEVNFNGGQRDAAKVLDLIKFRVWKWMKCKKKNFPYSSCDWTLNPLNCLGVGVGAIWN
ncbi:uncharacterized protein LOC130744058 [Lotus japonicus]|uniref:uncharacterized protein LOC130744058 n=1 Tax=Lotus japonicus TaxID=34305 RepID=UPI002585DC37|nr:uncharacterized protein LOC130744058 [Lotus japonicus]